MWVSLCPLVIWKLNFSLMDCISRFSESFSNKSRDRHEMLLKRPSQTFSGHFRDELHSVYLVHCTLSLVLEVVFRCQEMLEKHSQPFKCTNYTMVLESCCTSFAVIWRPQIRDRLVDLTELKKVSLCFLLVIRAWCFAAPFIRCYIITGCHLCELLYDIMQHRANSLYNIDV